MDAEDAIKKIIFRHLSPKEYQIFLFGSRAVGKNQRFSDFDVGVLGPNEIPAGKLSLIEEELENSDVPYKVDVVDFYRVRPEFKKVALRHAKLWTI